MVDSVAQGSSADPPRTVSLAVGSCYNAKSLCPSGRNWSWRWLAAAGSAAAGGAIRCPALVAAGDYLNQTDHHGGHYHLRLTGDRVTATFSTSRSAVPAWTREGTAPLFTVPPAFRPPYPILLTVVGQPVRADGNLDPDRRIPHRFLLQVGRRRRRALLGPVPGRGL